MNSRKNKSKIVVSVLVHVDTTRATTVAGVALTALALLARVAIMLWWHSQR